MADAYTVRVRIGAMLESREFDAVMGDAQKRAQKGAAGISRAMSAGDKLATASARQAARERTEALRSAEKEIASIQRAQAAIGRAYQRQLTDETRKAAKENARIAQEEATEKRRLLREQTRAERAAQNEREAFARRTSYRATRFLFPTPEGAFGYARRVGHDLLRGVGMDWSMQAGLQRSQENEGLATRLASQGYIPGQTSFENRIKAPELRKTAQAVAGEYAIAESEVIGAMGKFTDVTGDLKTAQDIIEQIALLSKATGTSIEDAASAAADMSMQLGDIPNKSAHIVRLLSVAAMGGKLGAVEMKDLARYVPKMAAQAGSFAAPAEKSIIDMMAVAQTARQYGGAPNAAVASTAVAAMVNTLKTPARYAQFKAHDVELYEKDKTGRITGLRDIHSIIKESIVAAKGSPVEFKKMWANVIGARAVEGYMNIYRKAGSGEAGLRAIDVQRAKFTAALDPEEQKKLKAENVSIQQARAQRFQIALDKVAQRLMENLIPALEQLEPKIKALVEAFGFAVEFVSKNLGSAIMLAIVGAIGRAGVESGFRTLVDRFMGAAGGALTLKEGFGTLGGALGNSVLALGAFAMAFGGVTALLNLMEAKENKKNLEASKSLKELDDNLRTTLAGVESNTSLTPKQKAEAKVEVVEAARKRLAWVKKESGLGDLTETGTDWLDYITRTPGILESGGTKQKRKEVAALEEQYGGLEREYKKGVGYELEGEVYRASKLGGGQNFTPAEQGEGPGMIDALAQAMAQALRNTVQQTRITNADDFKFFTPATPPPVVEPGTRQPVPGYQ